ncbi:retrovirus-related pol polyprotein from transposon TNT 1-94 [Tanacetum coccineum]
MLKTSLICLLSKASKTKSWLYHRRLSHLNFGTINKIAKDGLVRGIPKFQKDHMCSACALGKSKKSSYQPKAEDTNQEKLYLLHMDLCGPMHVISINGKRYILVIVDNYSRFTWVRFLRTKAEAPKAIIKCIKIIQVCLNATVRNDRTNNGAEFVHQTLHEFYENVGISHQTSVARTPQQNDVVKRRNQTLVEATRTISVISILRTYQSRGWDPLFHELSIVGSIPVESRCHRRWGRVVVAFSAMVPNNILIHLSSSEVAPLEWSNASLRDTMMMERARADRFWRRMSVMESQLRQIHRFCYYDRMRFRRLETFATRRLGFHP